MQKHTGRWVEFDMPPDARTIAGYDVGYFHDGQNEPAYLFHIDAAVAATDKPGVLRVPLWLGGMPVGHTFVVRVRSVARGRPSPWSPPSAVVTVSSAEAASTTAPTVFPVAGTRAKASRASRSGEGPPKAPRRSATTEFANDPELRKRVDALFPGRNLDRDAEGFRNVRDLVVALYAAADLKVRFEDIKRLTADAGNRNLRGAIMQLRPDADPKAVNRRAQMAATEALAAFARKRQ